MTKFTNLLQSVVLWMKHTWLYCFMFTFISKSLDTRIRCK